MATSIKALAESLHNLKSPIPSNYAYSKNQNEYILPDAENAIPVIDFSLLTAGNPDERSKAIHDLANACEEWGFFTVVNHGVPETLIKNVFDASNEFFNLTEEEKREFNGKNVLDPIKYGTSFHNATKILIWRDYLKVIAHPEFHCPDKPIGFSELALEYSKQTRQVASELLKGIAEGLGLEESYMEKALDLDSGLQLFTVNFYPACPQPEQAIGIPAHTDHGLLTLLLQNGVGGLQVQHNGKWVHVDAPPNSFMVNTSDHLEIFSNGKYKSVMHRAIVNDKVTRISLVTPSGPSLDTIVSPASKFVDDENFSPAYTPIKYKDYLEMQQLTPIDGILTLERIRIQ